ncbi:MAG: hypothetical protein RL189_376 [Pseudomonadota bacterium]
MKFYDIKSYVAVLACLAAVGCSDGSQFVQISKVPTGQRARVGESDIPSDRKSTVSGAISDSLDEGVASDSSQNSVIVADGGVGSLPGSSNSSAGAEKVASSGSGAASGSTGSGSGAASGSTGSGSGAASEVTGSVGHDCDDDEHDDCDEKNSSREEMRTGERQSGDDRDGGCDRNG